MMKERRMSQRIAVKMSVDLVVYDQSGKELAGPVKVEMETLSFQGGSVVLSSMQTDDVHFFYGCNDQEGCGLQLRFVDSKGHRYSIPCKPVWYNKELDKEPVYYQLGLEFSRAEDRETIKLLDRIARGKAEKPLSEVVGDFFKKQLIRAF